MSVKVCGGAVGCAALQNGGPGDRQSGLVEDRSGDTDRIGFGLGGNNDVRFLYFVLYLYRSKQFFTYFCDCRICGFNADCLLRVYTSVYEKIV